MHRRGSQFLPQADRRSPVEYAGRPIVQGISAMQWEAEQCPYSRGTPHHCGQALNESARQRTWRDLYRNNREEGAQRFRQWTGIFQLLALAAWADFKTMAALVVVLEI